MRPSSPSLPEHDFTLEALSQGLRVDGRGLLDARDVEILFGEELGMVECLMGRTRFVPLPLKGALWSREADVPSIQGC